jgi:hypothetical protein
MRTVTWPGVGEVASAVDFVSLITGETRLVVQSKFSWLGGKKVPLKKKETTRALLGRKMLFHGFRSDTPVVTFSEALRLMLVLPLKTVGAVAGDVKDLMEHISTDEPSETWWGPRWWAPPGLARQPVWTVEEDEEVDFAKVESLSRQPSRAPPARVDRKRKRGGGAAVCEK